MGCTRPGPPEGNWHRAQPIYVSWSMGWAWPEEIAKCSEPDVGRSIWAPPCPIYFNSHAHDILHMGVPGSGSIYSGPDIATITTQAIVGHP